MGTVDYIKSIPYDLGKFRLKMPQDICQKHAVSVRNLWNRQYGTPKEELYDVVLEYESVSNSQSGRVRKREFDKVYRTFKEVSSTCSPSVLALGRGRILSRRTRKVQL